MTLVSKGSKQRPTDKTKFDQNWENIFGTKSKEKRLRESIGVQHTESNFSFEWKATNFQEGSMQYAEYSVQYHAPTENH